MLKVNQRPQLLLRQVSVYVHATECMYEIAVSVTPNYLQELGWQGTDWIDLAADRDRWRALVNPVMNILVL